MRGAMSCIAIGGLCIIAACGSGGPESSAEAPMPAALRLGEALTDDARPYERALASRAFDFPGDHGAHPGFRHEWWYFTGNLEGEHDERFGFELTFFRFALVPPGTPLSGESSWRARQVYVAHFAVTDATKGRFHAAERYARGALDLAGAEASSLHVWLEDWSLSSQSEAGLWKMSAADGAYRLDLELRALKPPTPNGEAGLSRKSSEPGNASYYYSIPRLEARGVLARNAEEQHVQGFAWFDHEWGSSRLAPEQSGWDWFALQLDDGSELMFYALRRDDGTRDPVSAGTWYAADGMARALAHDAIDIEVVDHWTNAEGDRYPSGWRLRVPDLDVELAVHPVLAAQELETTIRYWEGAVDATGTRAGRALAGHGYVELTGYAR
jgi:predicted secreted hydrolase